MPNNIEIPGQLEKLKVAVENSDGNYFLTVWIPILVVLIGAFIAHIFRLIEKKRQRENLKYTIVLWLRESIQPIEGFIDGLQRFVEEAKLSAGLEPKRLFIPTFYLQCVKEFPIDKMSDALVARLKVNKKDKSKLTENFYDLYDCISNFIAHQTEILEAHSDYYHKMNQLKRDWDTHFTDFNCLTKHYLLAEDATDSECQFFNNVQPLIAELFDHIGEANGLFRRDIMHNFIQKMSDAFMKTTPTQRIIEANKSCNTVRIVLHHMETLHGDTIHVCETYISHILNPSVEHFSKLISFYDQHKIKGIFSFSNKLS